VIFFGFYPAPILDATAASSKAIVAQYRAAVGQPIAIDMPAPAAAPATAPAEPAK
jgi:NADH-quinone oxidoreductase subunit M